MIRRAFAWGYWNRKGVGLFGSGGIAALPRGGGGLLGLFFASTLTGRAGGSSQNVFVRFLNGALALAAMPFGSTRAIRPSMSGCLCAA